MSIFERKLLNKIYLDDSVNLSATIINAETIQGHTEYIIRVQRGLYAENIWHVHRRYNDFSSMHQSFRSEGVDLPIPPKKIMGNMEREFIAQRQSGLQKYLDIILSDPLLAAQLVVKKFLDPHNYTTYNPLGYNQISIKLRGELDIKIVKQLPNLGWRLRKEYYLVNLDSDNKDDYILTWTPFGPDKYLDDKQILAILKPLVCLQHVNIIPLIKAGICQDGGWVIRQAKKSGSVLDTMYGAKLPYTTSALRKYRSEEMKAFFSVPQVVRIAAQLLQTLAFLHNKGFYHGHLHLGNIILDGESIKLVDIENSLFGLPPYFRESLTKIKQIRSMQTVDIYCFGLVIYEMLFRKPFIDFHSKEIAQCPPIFKAVLESILCPHNKLLPTIVDLITNPLFHQGMPAAPPPYLKFSTHSKQHLIITAEKIFERLKKDQIKYRQLLKTKKMYQMLNDDGKLVIYFKSHNIKMGENIEINDSIDISNPSESISSRDSSKNSGCSEEKSTSTRLIDDGRSALLGSICKFNKNVLKKVNTDGKKYN